MGHLVSFRIFARWPFRRSEKAPPELRKPAELRLCRFSGPSRAGMLRSRRGKDWEWYLRNSTAQSRASRSSRHASRFKLTRSLVGCGIQIRSSRCSRSCCCSESEQILTSNRLTISLRAPEDCYRCGSLQLALTAYFRNMEVPSLTDHIKYWTDTINSLGYRNGMLTRFEILATSLRMSPARTRICQRLRRALIRS